jgi:hypothetical protein
MVNVAATAPYGANTSPAPAEQYVVRHNPGLLRCQNPGVLGQQNPGLCYKATPGVFRVQCAMQHYPQSLSDLGSTRMSGLS